MEQENRVLRQRLDSLKRKALENEQVLRRVQQRELALLEADGLGELIHALVGGLRDSFRLTEVTLLLNDASHEVRRLLMLDNHAPEQFGGLLLVDDLESHSGVYADLDRSLLTPFDASRHQPLFVRGLGIRSLAVLPLCRHGQLVGSLNLGSADPERFTRYHATDFLERLGIIAAACLENALNRQRLLHAGMTDVLTGWHNRRFLATRLVEEVARAQRRQEPLSVLFLDIDHFKSVNDTYGHANGDRVLCDVARRVRQSLRVSDVAVRYGGEEFVVLLPHTGREEAAGLAERIRLLVGEEALPLDDGQPLSVTLSCGVAELRPAVGENELDRLGERLLAEADEALYRAKRAGRNRVVLA